MPASYRIYRMENGGRLRLGERFHAASDEQAIAQARDLIAGAEAELWEGGRLVGRFSRHGGFRAGAGA